MKSNPSILSNAVKAHCAELSLKSQCPTMSELRQYAKDGESDTVQAHIALCRNCNELVLQSKLSRHYLRAWAKAWLAWILGPVKLRVQGIGPIRAVECPRCGHPFDHYHPPWFELHDSGTQPDTPNGPRTEWLEGEQTCPNCRAHWWVSDSS